MESVVPNPFNAAKRPFSAVKGSAPLLLALSLTASVGCNRSSSAESTESAPAASAASAKASEATIRIIVKHYEAIRHDLFQDQTSVIKQKASDIAKVAGSDADPALKSVQQAAAKLANQADSIDSARLAFGELSKQLVGLLGASALKQDLHLFSCPMAKGYKQWLQSDAKLGNPYMGQQMPGCGSDGQW